MKRAKVAGSGRKKGSKNKRTKAKEAAIAASGLTPLQYMLAVLRDPRRHRLDRMQAAIAAAPFVHQRLATTTLQTPPGRPLQLESLPAEPETIGKYHERLAQIAADRAAVRPAKPVGGAGVSKDRDGEGTGEG
jgi:hypothetical protein